jgi:hypothetical protein
MQEQLGIKMGTAKFPDDVIVIDHVEKPSRKLTKGDTATVTTWTKNATTGAWGMRSTT